MPDVPDQAGMAGALGAGGRPALLTEVDALYCDVMVQRSEQFTGQKAERMASAEETAHAEG